MNKIKNPIEMTFLIVSLCVFSFLGVYIYYLYKMSIIENKIPHLIISAIITILSIFIFYIKSKKSKNIEDKMKKLLEEKNISATTENMWIVNYLLKNSSNKVSVYLIFEEFKKVFNIEKSDFFKYFSILYLNGIILNCNNHYILEYSIYKQLKDLTLQKH